MAFVKSSTRILIYLPDDTKESSSCNHIFARKITIHTTDYIGIFGEARLMNIGWGYLAVTEQVYLDETSFTSDTIAGGGAAYSRVVHIGTLNIGACSNGQDTLS